MIAIPSIAGIQDPQVARILEAMKQRLDQTAGQNPSFGSIQTLGPTANFDGLLFKVNEIIGFLQDKKVQETPPKLSTSGITGGTNLKIAYDARGLITGGTSAALADLSDTVEALAWTPADGSGAGLTIGKTVDSCFYFKVGRMVLAWFSIVYPATVDATAAKISGLPVTCKASTDDVAGGYVTIQNVTASPLTLLVNNNAATFQFEVNATLRTNANMSGAAVRGCLVYPT